VPERLLGWVWVLGRGWADGVDISVYWTSHQRAAAALPTLTFNLHIEAKTKTPYEGGTYRPIHPFNTCRSPPPLRRSEEGGEHRCI